MASVPGVASAASVRRAEAAGPGLVFPHLKQLDGMRAIAVLIVFLSHCELEWLIPGGFGVTIFFFLSGYLITSLMRCEASRAGRVDLRDFYVRRTLRIMPPLYLTILVYLPIVAVVWPDVVLSPTMLVAQIFFLSNYVAEGFNLLPLWSLAVEEHFYLVFPLLFILVLSRMSARRAGMICAAACGAVLLIRLHAVQTLPDISKIYYYTHTRIDNILFGCVLALWRNPALDEDGYRPPVWHFLLALAVLVACLIVRDAVFRETWRYSIQGAALLVVFAYILSHRNRLTGLLASRPMELMARYSYTFYLIQSLSVGVVRELVPGIPAFLLIPAAFLPAYTYAAAMYRFVEHPLSRWRRERGKRAVLVADQGGGGVPRH